MKFNFVIQLIVILEINLFHFKLSEIEINTSEFNEYKHLFDVHPFDAQNGVDLQNRFDYKFYFSKTQLVDVLLILKNDFVVLSYNDIVIQNYKSEYLDSEDFTFYLHHHNGKRPRYKLRFRHYLDSGKSFFEIKEKLVNNTTIKYRSEIPFMSSEFEDDYLLDSPLVASDLPDILEYKLSTEYQRLTLISKSSPIRITVDTSLKIKNFNNIDFDTDIVLLEIKFRNLREVRYIMKQLRSFSLYPRGFSKYCFGLIQTGLPVKRNNFKQQLIEIKQLDPHVRI